MQWESCQNGEAQLKFAQDKAEGKKGPDMHTWPALVSSLKNVKNQHLTGTLGVRGVGLISSAFWPICIPALFPITGEACSPANHFPGFGTSHPQAVRPQTQNIETAFLQTHTGTNFSHPLVFQTLSHCLWLFSLPCHVALGPTTWLFRQQLSTSITIVFLRLGSSGICTFIQSPRFWSALNIGLTILRNTNMKTKPCVSLESSQSTEGRRQAGKQRTLPMHESQIGGWIRVLEARKRDLARLHNGRQLEDLLRFLLYIREGVAEKEAGGWWVGGQSKDLQDRAEGSLLTSIPVPSGTWVGFTSQRTFLLITDS